MLRRRRLLSLWGPVLLIALSACGAGSTNLPEVSREESIQVQSGAFAAGAAIPAAYTCDGGDVAPPLAWSGGPPAEEYVLVLTDPDAPGGTFTHWIVFGISGKVTELPEGGLPDGAREGVNDFDHVGYQGPCPPPGDQAHRYVFTLYSLRTASSAAVPQGASLQDVLDAIGCCIQAKGTLTGSYGR